MPTLIDKITEFESSENQTVADFNKIFTGSEITTGNLEDEVTIGEILGPVLVREVKVGAKVISHTFNSSGQSSVKGESQIGLYTKNCTTNEDLENTVLEEKELGLDPFEYKLLQYFRGCQSPFHTQIEIANKLRKSLRQVRTVISNMENKSIITTECIRNLHKIRVEIAEEWL